MQKIYKAAIVGGGAAGLLCAVELLSGDYSLRGEDVLILERNDRVGKKLLATGNGQGNVTNAFIGADNYSGDAEFISAYLNNLQNIHLTEYLKTIGIYTVEKEDGKIYPVSLQANSVLDALRAYLEYKGAVIVTGEKITELKNNGEFLLYSEKGNKYSAKNVVLCTGGKAGRQFGTDGTAYSLATALKHKLTPLYPSLVQLKTEKQKIKGLKGVKEYAKISLFFGDKFIKCATGDLLFTDYGVSGNAVFKISDKIGGAKDANLKIEFLPDLSVTELEKIIAEKSEKKFIPYGELLNGIVHKKIGQNLLCEKKKSPKEIAKEIKNFRLNVTGTMGFDSAQVTKGGIKTDDIAYDFESKIIKRLYLAGEMLDIDGECGGYNLTFAFVSGIVAAKSIKNNLRT